MTFFPIIELIDRLAIAELKFEKTAKNLEELEFYRAQIKSFNFTLVESEFIKLKEIHNIIWSLESELKTGKEQLLSLEEIGKRAIIIRDWNNKRISLKKQYCRHTRV